MLSAAKQRWKEKVETQFTPGQKVLLLLLAFLYIILVLFSAIPGLSVIIARNIAAQLDQETLARTIQSMCRRVLWLSTAGAGMLGVFLLGRFGCAFIARGRTRIAEWQNSLLESQKEHRFRCVLVRHFAILHNTDMFMLSWCAVFAAQFFLCLHGVTVLAWLLLVFPIFMFGAEMQSGTARPTRWYTKLGNLTIAAFLLLCQGLLIGQFEALHEFYLAKDMQTAVLQFFLMLLVSLTVLSLVLAFWSTEEKVERWAHNVLRIVVISMLLYFVLDVLLKALINEFDLLQVVTYITTDMFFALNGFNLVLTILFVMTVTVISSVPLGSTLLILLYAILVGGNIIKIKFHDSLLQPADFFSLKELFLIMPNYIGHTGVVLLSAVGIVLVAVLIWKIKRIGHLLMPHPSFAATVLILPVLIFVCTKVSSGEYRDVVSFRYSYYPEYVNYQIQGSFVYNYTNIRNAKDIFPSKPKGYSVEMVEEEKNKFSECTEVNENTECKPDVVLIMAESLFALNQIDDVSFNENPTQAISQYRVGSIVSPWYGGGTACVEFEGITGFSNLFFMRNLCAYTAYLNDSSLHIPSIATEFSKAGYETTALHLNDGNFYNRTMAYSILGFDRFYSLSDFAFGEDDRNDDGLVKDENFFSVIRNQLESDETPQFIFGVSIEGHGPYDAKYGETDIHVTAGDISEESKNSLEQYAQAVKNFDDDLAQFIAYLEQRERPTIVYVWGDHLPKLAVFDEIDYLDANIYNKYETPFVAYSNYKTITVNTAYMTPNQITPQILRDAGIPHADYYDYIYSLREDYPVLHHDYTTELNSERIQDYWLIQYDLMFGQQYLIQDSEEE